MSFIINPYWFGCGDADALAFLSAAGITDPTISSAICKLVTSMKANGTWTKCNAIYPLVGGTAATHKFNLKNPADTNAAFRLVFSGGWVHSANGAQTNGTNTFADTFLIPSTVLTLLSTHLSFYSRTSTIGNGQRDIAAFVNGSFPSFSLGTNTGVLVSDHYWFTTNRMTRSIPNAQGLMLTSRTSDTVHKAYRCGKSKPFSADCIIFDKAVFFRIDWKRTIRCRSGNIIYRCSSV